MGDITYPRVDGVVVIHGAFQRGDSIYLPRKGAKKILRFKGWMFKEIVFKKRSKAARENLESKFRRTKRKEYLQYLVRERRQELIEHGLTPDELANMVRGDSPSDKYQVHHILPLDDGGTNEFANFILTRTSEHLVLTAYQNSATRRLAEGDSVTMDYPVPCKNYAIHPPIHQSELEELQLWQRKR